MGVGNNQNIMQSKTRVVSTIKLIVFLLFIMLIGYIFNIHWLWKIVGWVILFFGATGIFELINIIRLKEKNRK